MKVGKKTSIAPLHWGGVSFKEFEERFKHYVSDEELKSIHKECVKIYKEANKEATKKEVVKPKVKEK